MRINPESPRPTNAWAGQIPDESTGYAFGKARHLKTFVLEKNDFFVQDFHLLCEVFYLEVPLFKQRAQGRKLGFQVFPLPDFVHELLRVGLVRIGVHFFIHHFCPPASKKRSFSDHFKVLGCNDHCHKLPHKTGKCRIGRPGGRGECGRNHPEIIVVEPDAAAPDQGAWGIVSNGFT